jgi:hypothetical protein
MSYYTTCTATTRVTPPTTETDVKADNIALTAEYVAKLID